MERRDTKGIEEETKFYKNKRKKRKESKEKDKKKRRGGNCNLRCVDKEKNARDNIIDKEKEG